MTTQYQLIAKYIKDFGSISPYEAFRDLGITKLATRISEMKKKGYKFADEWCTHENRYGVEVRYKRYYLEEYKKPAKGFWDRIFRKATQ